MTVRLAVFGLGSWGERHVSTLSRIDGVEIAAVCDSNGEKAKQVAGKFGIERYYSDYRQLLDSEKLDAVDVVTPEQLHKEIVVEAASRHLPTFVEKPIASTLEDADSMIQAAQENHVPLLVGHILRWDTRYAMVKEMISKGGVGKIAAISARRAFNRNGASRYLPYITPIMQSAVHDIDLILWYTGSHVKECYSRAGRALEYKNPDMAVSLLTLEDGSQVSMINSFSLPERIPFTNGARMEIYGSKSFVVVDATEQSLFICDDSGWRSPDTTLTPSVGGATEGTLKEELAYFTRCVRRGEMPGIITPREAREALSVAIACDRSLASERAVSLS